jgi:hypothetical protein
VPLTLKVMLLMRKGFIDICEMSSALLVFVVYQGFPPGGCMRISSIPVVLVTTMITASLFATGCDNDNNNTPLQPTRISTGAAPAFVVGVRPTTLVPRSIAGAVCPFQQPFLVPLELLVEGTSGTTVFLNRVGFQFIDSFGAAGPQTVTHQPTLLRRFGTVGLAAPGPRVFPFSVEFGCSTLPTGTINVSVQMIDEKRAITERTLKVVVR